MIYAGKSYRERSEEEIKEEIQEAEQSTPSKSTENMSVYSLK
jgi:hypothetical protein